MLLWYEKWDFMSLLFAWWMISDTASTQAEINRNTAVAQTFKPFNPLQLLQMENTCVK